MYESDSDKVAGTFKTKMMIRLRGSQETESNLKSLIHGCAIKVSSERFGFNAKSRNTFHTSTECQEKTKEEIK